ncbi:ureidoglycolate dehydrogenase [Paenibacillus albus]|uniref:Ureidoglycolate dehydrogenase n=1 Tax=Paenibacillus albus TaxID=2495582 RepID=A0A3S9A6I5_9BACL|nr:ureidoglycolate dehydrogenase [Paenibacillus albus]AZN41379.1 ureidoglycolate dehydrogenase [Paenibacillus albus]
MNEFIVSHNELKERCIRKFMDAGVPEKDANIATDVLVHANLRGVDSHGTMRMEHYIKKLTAGGIHATPTIQVRETGPVTSVVDGDDGLGHIVAYRAMEEAIDLAKTKGVGMVGAVNSSHCGALSYFVEMAAENRLIGMVMCNTDSGVVPFGGRSSFFGTNPIAYGFPAKRNPPVILDMATSTVAFGKVMDYSQRGKQIPAEWAVDAEGRSTTDPDKVRYMNHFGGAKGFGMAFVVDVFSSILMGAAFGPHVKGMYGADYAQPRKLAQFFCAVNPSYFTETDRFLEQMDQLIDELHTAEPAEGFSRVLVPGEPEMMQKEKRLVEGIPLPEAVYRFLFD